MTTALQTQSSPILATIPDDVSHAALEMAIGKGDLARLSSEDRLKYIGQICKWVGLNPLTKPIEIISFKGKDTLYATKSCAEQLRGLHKISVQIVERELKDGVYMVRARARKPDGQEDEAIGAVPCSERATPEDRANAMMKCETKAKRRVTLSLCGLGFMPDESELDTMRDVKPAAEVIDGGESVQNRIDKLNASLTTSEKTAAIDVPATPQESFGTETPHKKQDSTVAIVESSSPSQSSPTTPQPVPTSAKPSAPASDTALDDETARKLAIVFSERPRKVQEDAFRYLTGVGHLPADRGIEFISPKAAGFILSQTRRFFDQTVAQWCEKNPL